MAEKQRKPMQERAVLQSIEDNCEITKEQDPEFLYTVQNAILLAMKEDGKLTETQYRFAEGKLKEQRNKCFQRKQRKNS